MTRWERKIRAERQIIGDLYIPILQQSVSMPDEMLVLLHIEEQAIASPGDHQGSGQSSGPQGQLKDQYGELACCVCSLKHQFSFLSPCAFYHYHFLLLNSHCCCPTLHILSLPPSLPPFPPPPPPPPPPPRSTPSSRTSTPS